MISMLQETSKHLAEEEGKEEMALLVAVVVGQLAEVELLEAGEQR